MINSKKIISKLILIFVTATLIILVMFLIAFNLLKKQGLKSGSGLFQNLSDDRDKLGVAKEEAKQTDFLPAKHDSQIIKGEVIQREGEKLVIKTDQGEKTLNFTTESKLITRSKGSISKLSAENLVRGDKVSVDFWGEGEIKMLEKY